MCPYHKVIEYCKECKAKNHESYIDNDGNFNLVRKAKKKYLPF